MANEFKIKKGLIVTGATGGTALDVQGSQGQLFSVTDDLSGSIFAVSDISGVPILDVNSSGLSTFDGNVNLPDNKKILLGTGNDIELYHDGTHSHIINNTGDLTIDSQGDDLLLKAADDLLLFVQGTEVALQAIGNAGVKIRYNNLVKFETQNAGVKVTGSLTTTATGGGTGILMHTNSGISISSNLMQFWTGQSSGYKFYANSTGDETNELLALDELGNATFGGNIIVTGNAVNSDVIITSAELALLQLEDIGLNKTYNIELGRSSTAGDLTFRSTDGEKVRFTEAGNVGIGTDSPDYKLDVSSTSAVGARISTSGFTNLDLVSNRTSGNLGGLRFKQDIDAAQTGEFLGLHGGGFDWKVGNGNAAPSIKMRLDSGGKLGIGTTLPLYPLDVSGVAQASGFKSKTGTYTNTTETNKWQKVVSFGYSAFSFDSFKLLANIGGDTSNLNTNAEIHINYKFQNNNGRLYANIVNYGDTPLLAENFEIYRDGAAATITIFQKITRNYSTPSWTLINSPVNNPYTWYGTVVGANLNTETNDPWTAKTIINSVTTTMTDGNVGIGTTSPSAQLHLGAPENTTAGAAGTVDRFIIQPYSNTGGPYIYKARTVSGSEDYLDLYYGSNHLTSVGLNGNVGIGTTSPGAKLEVFGTGNSFRLDSAANGSKEILFRNVGTGTATIKTDGDLKLYTEDANKNILFETTGGEKMRIEAGGNVGIGTTSPDALFDVADRVEIDTYDSSTAASNAFTSGYLRIIAGAKTGWGADDELGKIEFYGEDSSGAGARTAASIIAVCEDGNGTSTTTFSSGLAFYTSPYNSTQEERIRIASDGNVGIGTTNPGSLLHIEGIRTTAVLQANQTGTGIIANFKQAGSSKVLIDNAGNVGIGTTTPSAKLDIQGTQGQLFSVTDDLSGDIFSVADISGVPIMNVNSDGTSYFDGKVGIGTDSPDFKLQISTPGIISGSAYSWPFDLSRVGSSTRGFSIGVGVAGGNIALGNHNGDMSLGQTYGADSNGLPVFYETMRISHDGTPSGGNVGIGTTVVNYKLASYSTTSEQNGIDEFPIVAGKANAIGNFTGIGLSGYITANGSVKAGIALERVGSYGTGKLHFLNNDTLNNSDATLSDSKMTILRNGNVGIGTTSPNTPLEVTGGISTTSSDFVIASTGERLLLQTAPSPYSYSYIQATSAGGTLISEVLALQPNGGYVGIGTTSAQSKLDIVGTTNTSNSSLLRVRTSNNPNAPEKVVGFYVNTNTERGFISVNQYSTTYSTSSDYRLKENIVPISNSIERLKELKPCRFNFIQGDPNYVVDGFIAHEAAEVIPEAVTGEKDAVDEDNNPLYQGIDQSKVVPLLTAALKEAISKIEQLETRIQTLENN